jgi:energy-coupling factor transporter ATP-binding protein EcfA2
VPLVDCVMECPVHDSFRVQQLAGMFDVALESKSRESFSAEVPGVEEDWQIGAIVGPSGSGKSSVARQAFGERLHEAREWDADKAVIDCFGERSVKDITAMLTAVGFSSPPAWVRPYHVLSNGQKFRCDLARAMLDGGELIAFDEFTSVVDRTVAKIGSAAVAKAIRSGRACKRFVAVACHYDIIDWLEPDWVLDMASGQLARGRLWRRPEISIRLYNTSHKHWRLFAKHHYLDSKEIPGAMCYVAEIDGVPACFVAVRSAMGHFGVRRISRIVTMPDFQGVGVGMACLNAVAELTLKRPGVERVTIVSGHPAMMRGLNKSERWELMRFMKSGGPKSGGVQSLKTSNGRATAAFQFVPALHSAPETTTPNPSTESDQQAVADHPAASTTDLTQMDRPLLEKPARSRSRSPSRSKPRKQKTSAKRPARAR